MMKVAILLVATLALAAPATATHFNSIEVAADCDGFVVTGNVRIAYFMTEGADLTYTVQALQDGVVKQEVAGVFPVELVTEGFAFEFGGSFVEPLAGANEISFHFFIPDGVYGNLDETHSTTVECSDTSVETHRPRYWYRHQGEWPVQELEIGGETLSQNRIGHLMVGCWRHSALRNLFRHTVAAKLNLLNGAMGDIESTIAEADAFLASHERGERLCRAERREARSIKNILRTFNRGNTSKAMVSDVMWDESEIEETTLGDVKALYR
jgi:hypothetical protein